MDWLDVLRLCSQRIRDRVLPLLGSSGGGVELGVGAGGDITKRIDLAAEEALINTLRDFDVSCTLISEESGVVKIGSYPSEFYVIADPVDGTTNATRGLPFAATSIAVSRGTHLHGIETALVLDLLRNITYTAQKGRGAFRNGRRIRPSSISSLKEAVIGIDFNIFRRRELLNRLENLLKPVKYLRHLGANALEVCYVADGTMDMFIDLRGKLRITDIAAAYLILKEAGGFMITPSGEDVDAPLGATQRVAFIAIANQTLYNLVRELML